MRGRRRSECGQSLAWTAVFFALVAVPLMTLTFDVTRLMGARSQVSAGTDAGCAALVANLDAEAFQNSGIVRPRSESWARALLLFHAAAPTGAISISPLAANRTGGNTEVGYACQGRMAISPLFGWLGTLSVQANAVSKARWSVAP